MSSRNCQRLGGLPVGDGDRVHRRCPDGQRCSCWQSEALDRALDVLADELATEMIADAHRRMIAVDLVARPSDQPCAECDGTGRALVSTGFLGDDDPQEDDCLFCNATGYQLIPIGQEAP